jgi:hypothetical protein
MIISEAKCLGVLEFENACQRLFKNLQVALIEVEENPPSFKALEKEFKNRCALGAGIVGGNLGYIPGSVVGLESVGKWKPTGRLSGPQSDGQHPVPFSTITGRIRQTVS